MVVRLEALVRIGVAEGLTREARGQYVAARKVGACHCVPEHGNIGEILLIAFDGGGKDLAEPNALQQRIDALCGKCEPADPRAEIDVRALRPVQHSRACVRCTRNSNCIAKQSVVTVTGKGKVFGKALQSCSFTWGEVPSQIPELDWMSASKSSGHTVDGVVVEFLQRLLSWVMIVNPQFPRCCKVHRRRAVPLVDAHSVAWDDAVAIQHLNVSSTQHGVCVCVCVSGRNDRATVARESRSRLVRRPHCNLIPPVVKRSDGSAMDRLPEDLRDLIFRHRAALTIQRAWVRRILFAHARHPRWDSIRSHLKRIHVWPGLARYTNVRREWRHEPESWCVSSLQDVMLIQTEAAAGLWGAKTHRLP